MEVVSIPDEVHNDIVHTTPFCKSKFAYQFEIDELNRSCTKLNQTSLYIARYCTATDLVVVMFVYTYEDCVPTFGIIFTIEVCTVWAIPALYVLIAKLWVTNQKLRQSHYSYIYVCSCSLNK